MGIPVLGRNAVMQIDGIDVGYAQGVRIGINGGLVKEYKIVMRRRRLSTWTPLRRSP